eukprot:TRINITY_DN23362_c0_g1_i1.p1 TRINITY_DN23362_c0_g1~~TRINITY_DN23362_c0_g1_i1.p1  ORF type:complete len:702 (+),score=151.37 TRINITY_DN23362_c0_g1_i1:193-2106(+)
MADGWVEHWAAACLSPTFLLIDLTPDTPTVALGPEEFLLYYNRFLGLHEAEHAGGQEKSVQWDLDESTLRDTGQCRASAEVDTAWTWSSGEEGASVTYRHRVRYEFLLNEDTARCEAMALRALNHFPRGVPRRFDLGEPLDAALWEPHQDPALPPGVTRVHPHHAVSVSGAAPPAVPEPLPEPRASLPRQGLLAVHFARRRAAAGLPQGGPLPAAAVAGAWCELWRRAADPQEAGGALGSLGEMLCDDAVLIDCTGDDPVACTGRDHVATYVAELLRSRTAAQWRFGEPACTARSARDTAAAQVECDWADSEGTLHRMAARWSFQAKEHRVRLIVCLPAGDPSALHAAPKRWAAGAAPSWARWAAGRSAGAAQAALPLLVSGLQDAFTGQDSHGQGALAELWRSAAEGDCVLESHLPCGRPVLVRGRDLLLSYFAEAVRSLQRLASSAAEGPPAELQWRWGIASAQALPLGDRAELQGTLGARPAEGGGGGWQLPLHAELGFSSRGKVQSMCLRPTRDAARQGEAVAWDGAPPTPADWAQYEVGGGRVHLARPCGHNSWENIRCKRGWVVYRCAECDAQWRRRPAADLLCSDYAAPSSCPRGAACPALHVARTKRTAAQRAAQRRGGAGAAAAEPPG